MTMDEEARHTPPTEERGISISVWPPAEWCAAINPERTHICDRPKGHDGDHGGPEMPTVTLAEDPR